MEDPILEIAFSNVLEELKEVNQEQQKIITTLLVLNKKVDSFEQKLLNLKVTPPETNMVSVTTTIMHGLDKIKSIIEAQPKSITRQFRILLFPEYGAREYYGLVFGRILMWMFFILIAAYLFALGKEYIRVNATVGQAQTINDSPRKVWKHESKHIKKTRKVKMDTVNMKR